MNVAIVGGGISGLSAAKVVLKAGMRATIIESTSAPGGLMARIANCRVGFSTFYDEIGPDPRLTVINDGNIAAVEKKDGEFHIVLENGRSVSADGVVIAAGLTPYDPVEYKGRRVLTSLEYDALIDQRKADLPADFRRIAFVLCVGSRSEEYPLCSSVCCSYTIRQIKWTLQRAKPDITVFYNDLRLFGQEFYMEKLYREGGVRFVRANSRYFEEEGEEVRMRYFAGGRVVEEAFDYAVLAIGLRPGAALPELSRLFGFSLNEWGFVKEEGALKTDVEGIYACGGALEPMSIKDAILTGFGAGLAVTSKGRLKAGSFEKDERLYREEAPEITVGDGGAFDSCLFYLGTEDAGTKMFYELMSWKFIEAARRLKKAGKTVYVIDRNISVPSYGELAYEQARREGVFFIHLEEEEDAIFDGRTVRITGGVSELSFTADKIVRLDDYADAFKHKEFLSVYRSEPQLRWSPTKWGRKRYHVGFIRHPRAARWEARELLGALGEMRLDEEEERVFPEVDEERCSGCGSCRNACPHSAIEMELRETAVALFGPDATTAVPIAHIKTDVCVGCGLCASTCASEVIAYKP